MKRLLALLLLTPGSAFALDLDYYTYDGFQPTVDAFTRLALVISDHSFAGFAFTFALAGIMMAVLFFVTRAHMGQANNPTQWMFPVIFGMCVYLGFVNETGTIYVYDPVINANQAVPGVPDLVVLVAGGLNELERDIIEVISTAGANPIGSAGPYDSTGGMMSFNLLMASMGAAPDDIDLARSLSQYYSDCGTFAISTNYNAVSLQELMRTSTDLYATFAKFADPAIFTTVYASGYDMGVPETCSAAWSGSISPLTNLSTQLGTMTGGLQQMENEICQKVGFDVTQAGQVAACDTNIAALPALLGVPGAGSLTYLRSVALAQSVTSALQRSEFNIGQSQVMNRQMMVESMGSSEAMNEWIPKLRAFMTAAVLGLIPLCCLFLVTPLAWKSVALVGGLFFWLFFWGTADAIASQMANDQAVNAFAQIAHYGLGYDAITNTPEGAVKALALFGKARMMSLTIATLLSSSLLAFGGLALSNLSQNWQKDIESRGESAARTALLPEQRSQFQQSLASGVATQDVLTRNGFGAVAGAEYLRQGGAAAGAEYVDRKFGTQHGVNQFIDEASAVSQGRTAGDVAGGIDASLKSGGRADADSVGNVFARTSEFATSKWSGSNIAEEEGLAKRGTSAFDAGSLSGGSAAGETAVLGRLYETVNGNRNYSQDGWERVRTQTNASTIGMAEALKGNSEAGVGMYRIQSNESLGMSDAIRNDARFVGLMSGFSKMASSDGFKAAMDAYGFKGVVSGRALSEEQTASQARFASQAAGSTVRYADLVSQIGAARNVGEAQSMRSVASFMGFNPSDTRELSSSMTRRGLYQVGVPVGTEKERELLLNKAVRDGAITQEHADEVKESGFLGGARVTLSPAGTISSLALDLGDTTTVHDDFSKSKSDFDSVRKESLYTNTDTRHYEKAPTGGLGLWNRDDLGHELVSAYRGLGYETDQVRFSSLSEALGKGLETRGISVSASDAYQSVKSGRVGLNAGLSGGIGIPQGTPLSGSASVGLSGAVEQVWQDTKGNQTSLNGNTLIAAAALDSVRSEARAQIGRERGETFVQNPANADFAGRLVAERQAELALERLDSFAKNARDQVTPVLNSNDAVKQQSADDGARNRKPLDVRQAQEVQRLRAEPRD